MEQERLFNIEPICLQNKLKNFAATIQTALSEDLSVFKFSEKIDLNWKRKIPGIYMTCNISVSQVSAMTIHDQPLPSQWQAPESFALLPLQGVQADKLEHFPEVDTICPSRTDGHHPSSNSEVPCRSLEKVNSFRSDSDEQVYTLAKCLPLRCQPIFAHASSLGVYKWDPWGSVSHVEKAWQGLWERRPWRHNYRASNCADRSLGVV